jgi:hypothetical protein
MRLCDAIVVVPAAVLSLGSLACVSSGRVVTERLESQLRLVDEWHITPSPNCRIRQMEAVVWINTSREHAVSLVIRKSCEREIG